MSERLEILKQYLEADPKDSFLLFAIAKEYEKMANEPVALEYYLKIKTDDPEYIGLYYHLGKLYERIDKIEDARATYLEGIELAKERRDFHAASELNGAFEAIEA